MQVYQTITCPHCWQAFEVGLDVSVPAQCMVYDCEICCNPLEIEYRLEGDEVVECEVSPAQ